MTTTKTEALIMMLKQVVSLCSHHLRIILDPRDASRFQPLHSSAFRARRVDLLDYYRNTLCLATVGEPSRRRDDGARFIVVVGRWGSRRRQKIRRASVSSSGQWSSEAAPAR